jgi:uncharacterized protein DUF6519
MKAEFSRLTHDRRQHFAGVLQQQGRVWTDADVNEWVQIVLERFRTQSRDAFGPVSQPSFAPGFTIGLAGSAVTIGAGRLYVDGLLAELDADTPYGAQPDFPFPARGIWQNAIVSGPRSDPWPGVMPIAGARDLFYVEVWQRHLTAINDEAARDDIPTPSPSQWNTIPSVGDFIRERALGGVDTCTRLRTVAQVKRWTLPNDVAPTCDAACKALAKQFPPKTDATLLVTVPPIPPVVDPCEQPLDGGYNGGGNALYRVEIHQPGAAGTATYKWSAENAALTVRVNAPPYAVVNANTALTLRSIGRDQITQLRLNDVVELCGEDTELNVWRNPLARIVGGPDAQTDGTWQVKLDTTVMVPRAPFLRRWNAKDAPIPALGTAVQLDAPSAIDVQFFDANGAQAGTPFFHAMDYWTFSARTSTRDIEPPNITHVPQAPGGIERAVTCLALITWQPTPGAAPQGVLTSCLPEPPDAQECGCCCTATVEPVSDDPKRDDTQALRDALDALPVTGGTICMEPGEYLFPHAVVIDKVDVTIRGCGDRTRIVAPFCGFIIGMHAARTRIEQVAFEIDNAPAVISETVAGISIVDTTVRGAAWTRSYAYSLRGSNLRVERNHVTGAGGVEIRTASSDVTIAGNVFEHGTERGISLGSPAIGVEIDLGVEQTVRGVRISDNEIRDMAAEAIGMPFSVHGSPMTLIVADDVRIEENVIERCLTGDLPNVGYVSHDVVAGAMDTKTYEAAPLRSASYSTYVNTPSAPPAPPAFATNYAPVFLPIAQHVLISENRIVGEATGLATSGIALLVGLGVTIRDNHITQLGLRPAVTDFAVARGGISLLALPPSLTIPSKTASGAPADPADPLLTVGAYSVRIAGNTVEIDGAPAIALNAVGTVVITDNQLARRRFGLANGPPGIGTDPTGAADPALVDAPVVSCIMTGLFGGWFSSGQVVGGWSAPYDETRLLQAGELVFDGNRCLLDLPDIEFPVRAAVVVDVVGDASVQHNVSRVASRGYVYTNALLNATTLRCSGNRFTENIGYYSAHGTGTSTVAVGNSGSHCFNFAPFSAQDQLANLVDPGARGICDWIDAYNRGKGP